MENRALFPGWKRDVRGIFDWVYRELGNREWEAYGVVAVNEQTAYRVPGNSHTARQAAAELRYAELTGETDRKASAIRQLSRAMAAAPELAPAGQDHVLRSTGVVSAIDHGKEVIQYRTFDPSSREVLRLAARPKRVALGAKGEKPLEETADLETAPGWTWTPLRRGGVLRLRHDGEPQVWIEMGR